jgi:hypothetical protein
MRIARQGKVGLGVLIATLGCALGADPARAQSPDTVALGQGSFSQLGFTWQANAARPNGILFDFFNSEGTLSDSYETSFAQAPPKRGLSAVGQRPFGLPTTAAVVYGVAGTRVKKVKLLFVGGLRRTLQPAPVPANWGFSGRFFAAGVTIGDAFAGTTQAVTRIRALDRKGRVVSTLTNVFTNPF